MGSLAFTNWTEMMAHDAVQVPYWLRSLGGGMFILGWVLMIYNLVKTARAGRPVEVSTEVARLVPPAGGPSTARLVFGAPLVVSALGMLAAVMFAAGDVALAPAGLVLLAFVCVLGAYYLRQASAGGRFRWHDMIETRPLAFTVLVVISIVVGGVVELVPGIVVQQKVPLTATGEMAVAPYTPLELEGRDIYVREGCYVCHSQMIRPFREEFLRYGPPSRIEESMWDHPFQWGSKRTGPDLARVGGKYGDQWHYDHMINPRNLAVESNMPAYPWLLEAKVDTGRTPYKIKSMKALGVPYEDVEIASCDRAYREQADAIVAGLAAQERRLDWDSELTALIAYLQRLGKNSLPTEVGAAK